MANKEINDKIPKGWVREEVVRKNGVNKGKIDIYVKSPKGKIFRSKKELASYIEKNKLPFRIDDFTFSTKKMCTSMTLNNSTALDTVSTDPVNIHSSTANEDILIRQNNTEPVTVESNTDVNIDISDFQLPQLASKETQTDVNHYSIMTSKELLSKHWLTDSTLDQYFNIINNRFLQCKTAIVLNPVICQYLKCAEDYVYVIEPLNLHLYKFLFIPVNDAEALGTEGGSHWSFLLFDKENNTFHYYDSLNGKNYPYAVVMAKKLSLYLSGSSELEIGIVDGPQQKNCYDCGVYTCCIIDWIIYNLIENKSLGLEKIREIKLSEADLINKRSIMAYVIPNSVTTTNETLHTLIFKLCKHFMKSFSFITPSARHSSFVPLLHNDDLNTKTTLNQCNKALTQFTTKPSNSGQDNGKMRLNSHFSLNKKSLNRFTLFADSHGKELSYHLNNRLSDKFSFYGHVLPSARMENIISAAEADKGIKDFTKSDYILLIGGTNDISREIKNNIPKKNVKRNFLLNVEAKVHLFSHTNLILATVPFRYDLHQNSYENQVIWYINDQLKRLIIKYPHLHLLDLWLLPRHSHTQHGLHINKTGKRMIAHEIKMLTEGNSLISQNNRTNDQPFKNSTNITDENMSELINKYKENKNVGFAHSISADYEDPRHMTAGVAVVFKNYFGKPQLAQRITNHLALQNNLRGATVYSLITKSKYYGKPSTQDYNTAFNDLTIDFKKKGLEHLICSPIGSVRDLIELEHLVNNLKTFHKYTKAKITIVSHPHESYRKLRNGLTHQEFNKKLQQLINSEPSFLEQPVNTSTDAPPVNTLSPGPTTPGDGPSPSDEVTGHPPSTISKGASVECDVSQSGAGVCSKNDDIQPFIDVREGLEECNIDVDSPNVNSSISFADSDVFLE